MSGFREELEQRVAESEAVLDKEVQDFLAAKDRVLQARQKTQTWRAALADESSKNGHAYIAPPLKTAADPFLGLSSTNGAKPQAKAATPPLLTKTGVIRDTIREHSGLKPKQIYDKIAAKKLDLKITYADVQKTIPKLINQEKIYRDTNGGLRSSS